MSEEIKRGGQAGILSPAQIKILFESFQSRRDRTLFGICLYTGTRIAEACAMHKKGVFYDNGQIREKIIVRKSTTKGKLATRNIPIHPNLAAILADYYAEAAANESDYLFPGRHGRGHLHPDSASYIFRKLCKELGFPEGKTHSFRRTALTFMHSQGIPLGVIQRISGHKSLSALQRYLEVTEEQMKQAVLSLEFEEFEK